MTVVKNGNMALKCPNCDADSFEPSYASELLEDCNEVLWECWECGYAEMRSIGGLGEEEKIN